MWTQTAIDELCERVPVVKDIAGQKETVWINPGRLPFAAAMQGSPLTMADVEDAAARLDRFAAYFLKACPETRAAGGRLESPLQAVPHMQAALGERYGALVLGKLLIKLDSHLPVSGSIKARGGIYEVLKTAEDIALANGLLAPGDSYEKIDTEDLRSLFSRYRVAVGSTGNLGLSIGIMSAKLGFDVTVHMSADARQWKKDMLRSKGAKVVEYDADYSVAVKQGRREAENDPFCHFVDDENSQTLFLGYSVAALRLRDQLAAAGIPVDAAHPLFVYLPCGVGGGPGGVAFGLKQVFGDAVHCFFAEPVQSCCMMLGMATGLHDRICVQDLGLDNKTAADGLAVGRASSFVGGVMAPHLGGCYSLTDARMSALLALLADTEGLYLEPSALAGAYGPVLLQKDPGMREYLRQLSVRPKDVTQLIWATGGSMVPKEDMERYYQAGKAALSGGEPA